MGYVGRGLNQDGGQYRKLDSIATSFNGSETNFTLTIDGLEVTPTAQNLMISLGGVIQEPGTAFTVNGSTITFASAPADATTFFGVLMGEATFIARGTVGAAEMGITAGAVSASAGVVVDSSKNVIGFNEISASIFKGSFSGDTSSSINTRINSLVTDSGSFSTRITNATASINSISSSQATRTANLVIASSSLSASVATLKGSGTLQSVATNASPTFAGATITGTLTAQEVHTEFESASILFTSGSTQFGNSSDDVHDFKGNTISGSATSTGSFGSAHFRGVGGVGIGTNNPTVALEVFGSADQQIRIDSTGNRAQLQFDGKKTSDAEFAEINFANDGDSAAAIHAMRDGANDAARLAFMTQATGGGVTERMSIDSTGNVGIGTNNPTKLLDIESSGTEASMDFTNDARTYRIGINDFGTGDDRLFFTDVTADATRLSIKADGTIHSHNSAIHITTDGTDDGDYNGAVLSRGVLSLNRDDTATVKQVKFHKNGSEHSSLETTSDGFNISGSKVGIGTRVPLAKMHVEHTTDDTDENGNIALTVGGGAAGDVRHYWGVNNSSNYAYYGAVEHGTQYVPLVLQPNGSKVGIGATSPAGHLEVAGSTDYSQIHLTDTDSNNTVQRLGIQGQHYGSSEAPIRMIGMYNSDTTSNVQIGGGSGDHNSATKIQFFTSANTTTSAGTLRMLVDSNGKIGIGTDSPGELVHMYGGAGSTLKIEVTAGNDAKMDFKTTTTEYRMGANIGGVGNDTFSIKDMQAGSGTERVRIDSGGDFYTNDGSVSSLSDRRAKKDILDLEDGLSIINQLRPRTFKYNGRTVRPDDGVTRYGFIADEVLEVASQYVNIGEELLDGEMVDDFKTLSPTRMIPMMIKAIQELSTEVQSLKAQVSGSN